MNIGDKADELADRLDALGFKGFTAGWPDGSRDHISLKEIDFDFAEMLKDHFASEGETVEIVRPDQTKRDDEMPQVGSVIVVRMQSLDDIEIYRLVDGVMPIDDEE